MDDTGGPRLTRTPHAAVRCAFVAVAYAAAGLASGMLAVDPGYATALWPAAGIALAGVILWGAPATLGVALGSFAVNLSIAAERGLDQAGVILAVAIGLGAAAQAAVGAALVRTLRGAGNPLDRASTMAPVLLLGGPVACLVNAVWGVSCLWLAGTVATADVFANAFTWWAGDSIGVMFATPLLLAWSLQARARGRYLWLGVTVPLAVSFLVVIAVFWAVGREDDEARQRVFDDHASEVLGVIEADLQRTVAYSESTSRALGVLAEVTGAAIRSVTTPWLEVAPSLQALEYAPVVPAEALSSFERRIRAADDPGFRVWDIGAPARGGRVGARAEYAPILYVEPYGWERTARGADLASEPRRAAALDEARKTGRSVLSAGVPLLNAPEGYGAILASPVYGELESTAGEGAPVRGFLVAVLHVPSLVRSAFARTSVDDVRLRITDHSDARPLVLYGSEGEGDGPTWSTRLEVGGRTWQVDAYSLVTTGVSWTGFVVLLAGVVFVGLLVSNVLDMANRASQIAREVELRTAALARTNAALERSNLELQRFAYAVSHDLREPLRSVVGFGELLELEHGPRLGADGQDLLKRVVAGARRTQDRVHALLDVARAGGRAVPFERVSLREPLDVAMEALHDSVLECGGAVEVGYLPEVLCDRAQMAQVFSTLLSNALKFRRPDVSCVIEVGSRRLPDAWEIAVRDNGAGIPRHHLARVFELFERVGPPVQAGDHVGLALVRRIVERHGGAIHVESEPGAGAVFRFSLPDRMAS